MILLVVASPHAPGATTQQARAGLHRRGPAEVRAIGIIAPEPTRVLTGRQLRDVGGRWQGRRDRRLDVWNSHGRGTG